MLFDPYVSPPTTAEKKRAREAASVGLNSNFSIYDSADTLRLITLVAKGLVDREPDPKDRRSVIVSLTPHGRAIVDRALPDHVENERRMLEVLAPDERGELARLLQKLLVGLGDAREEPAEATLTFTATIPPYRSPSGPMSPSADEELPL